LTRVFNPKKKKKKKKKKLKTKKKTKKKKKKKKKKNPSLKSILKTMAMLHFFLIHLIKLDSNVTQSSNVM